MNHIGADFLFTGEVLGQRPMSQKRHSMKWIEKESGLEGRLLRPLCAQLLEPTIPEKEGLIDRNKLLNMSGRSRKPQIQLADELTITEYNQPAGGCRLTDPGFSNRMQDTLTHGYRNFRETIALQWGRHFRINDDFKAIVGRDQHENESLVRFAHRDDTIMLFSDEDKAGATLLLKGYGPSEKILSTAAGLIQQFSKYKDDAPLDANCWPVNDPNHVQCVPARKLEALEVQSMYI
jgi:tRNA-specific 2-thiouridylase